MIGHMKEDTVRDALIDAYDPDMEWCGHHMVKRIQDLIVKEKYISTEVKAAVISHLQLLAEDSQDTGLQALAVTKSVERVLCEHHSLQDLM